MSDSASDVSASSISAAMLNPLIGIRDLPLQQKVLLPSIATYMKLIS